MAFQQASTSADNLFDETPSKRASKNRNGSAAEGDEDRISELSDDLLRRILSLLPAHEAVRTCVLSRRWGEVWKAVRVLRFTAAETWGSAARFNRFVNDVLSFRDPALLEEFEVKTYMCFPPTSSYSLILPDREEPVRYAKAWIQYALMREVQVLRVLVNSRNRPLLQVDTALVSEHLRTLVLHSAVLGGSSMDFSCCPTLDDLELTSCLIMVREIGSPSLRRLSVNNCDFSGDICTKIMTPNLLSLRLDVDGGWVPFLQSMPWLVTAYVKLVPFCTDHCRGRNNFLQCGFDTCVKCYGNHHQCVILGGLSNATNLELAAQFLFHSWHLGATIFKREMRMCAAFRNLKTLVLDGWVVVCEIDALICFLQHTPVLEKITLRLYNELRYEVEMEESCSSLEKFVPSEHLKVVEVKCTKVVKNVHKFVGILNSYGIASDLISIQETDS